MRKRKITARFLLPVALATVFLARVPSVLSQDTDALSGIAELGNSSHLELIGGETLDVTDHEIGLGTLKKVRGAWQFKDSERLSGQLLTYTWQIHDGYTSHEVLEGIEGDMPESAELLFHCDGRACGSGAQWASRVFGQRLLYGREDLQRYRVYRIPGDGDSEESAEMRVLFYAAARSADRQYLHAQVLLVSE